VAFAAVLPRETTAGTIDGVEDDEATQVMLGALFDIEGAVDDIRDVSIEPPEDDDEATEEDDP
jgi:hypothetical protein